MHPKADKRKIPMAKAGRPKGSGGVKLTETHRDKIRKSNILNNLIEHVEGKREMTSTQVTAGLGLLKKALPDLQSVEHTGSVEHSVISKIEREIVSKPKD